MGGILRHSLLIALFVLAVGLRDVTPASAAPPRWSPKDTRVFVVSMTRYKGGVAAPWGEKGRLDYDLMRLFKQRGVPDGQAVMLTDEGATIEDVKRKFVAFLEKSKPGEMLIFDFSSHGGYDPKKGTYSFSAYDGPIQVDWFFDAIEQHFRGSQAFLLADCCYSGSIVELAKQRHGKIAYACLSTTWGHNVAYSGWRFFDCLMRGFSGNPVVDLNGDGLVELDELALFSRRHMAFVAEGLPMFYTTRGFDPKTVLVTANGRRKPAPVGNYVMAVKDAKWRKAEITDTKPGELRVHYTDKDLNSYAWLKQSQVRPFEVKRFANGAKVEVNRNGWEPATVKGESDGMVLCAFDGFSSAYDEWVGQSRIRAPQPATNLSGGWVGSYVNSTGGKGKDSLTLSEDARGNLTGNWSGDTPVVGRRTSASTASLTGKTKSRSYAILATLQKNVLTLKYTAQRLDGGGSYSGTVTLTHR